MRQVYCGLNGLQEIKSWVNSHRFRRLILFTGRKSYDESTYRTDLENALQEIEVRRFSAIDPNPDLNSIKSAYEQLKLFGADGIIAVGGGSVLDFAKILNFILDSPLGLDALNAGKTGNVKPLLAIPTTTGTGSESTQFATYYKDKIKQSLDTPTILPEMAIVDAHFSISEPQTVAAQTGVDAFTQSVESFWSCKANIESLGYAEKAISLLKDSLVTSVIEPSLEARQKVAEAANFGGRAIQITRTTAAHAVSYPLTSYFGVPHGHAVGLCLQLFFEYNDSATPEKVNAPLEFAGVRQRLEHLYKILGVENGPAAAQSLTHMMKSLGLATSLREVGVQAGDLDLIVENSYTPSRMSNNPFAISKTELKELLQKHL